MPEEYFAINHSMSRRTPSTMDSAGILAEVVALNGSKGTIALGAGTWRIDLATVIPSSVRLVVEQGALLTKNGAVTLTINGPFEAPLAQVFSGFAAGEVTLGTPDECNVRWFGAKGDGVSDDSESFQGAISSSAQNIKIPPGNYLLGTSLNLTSRSVLSLRGHGSESVLTAACAGRSLFDCTGANTLTFERFRVVCSDISKPQSAFLFSRKANNHSAGMHVLRDLLITGSVTKAAVISLSSEVNHYVNVVAAVTPDAYGCVIALLEQNTIGASTSYETFPESFSGGNTTHRIIGGVVNNFGVNTSGIWITNARDVSLVGLFLSDAETALAGILLGDLDNGTQLIQALSMVGCSAEWSGTYGLFVAQGCTLQDSGMEGVFYKGILGANGSVINACRFSGFWQQAPAINADTMTDCTILSRMYVQIRTLSVGNTMFNGRYGDMALPALPAATLGTQYGEYLGRSDGAWLGIRHICDSSALDRFQTQYVNARVYRTRVQKFAGASGAYAVDENLGATCSFSLVGNVSISTSSLMAPVVEGSETWDEGCRLTFIFRQDASGGHTVSFSSMFVPPPGWQIDTNPSAISVITFTLDTGLGNVGKWIAEGCSTGKPVLPGDVVVGNLPAPGGIILSTGAGTLAPGNYAYRLTSVSAYGESSVSPAHGWELTATGGVVLGWSSVPGALAYKIYGRVGGSEQLLGTTGALTFADDGSLTPSGAMPAANTASSFSVPGLLLHGTRKITQGTAAPTSGTWAVGDRVYNTAPSAGGWDGWICVGAGTPGTWKGFGAIEI